jgi:DNA-binding NtrC family response regulator
MDHEASILLVDDDIELLKALTKVLERSGYTVTGHHCAETAIQELRRRQEPYDLVITDESMPGMRGIDLLHTFKESFPQMPIIIMTAFGDWGQYMEAMNAGAFEFVTKPVNKTELLAVVQRALEPPTLRQSA